MEEKKPQWKGCIIFGLVNIGLVLLCTKLHVVLLSASLILLIVVSVVAIFKCLKEDWQAGLKGSAIGCAIGLLLDCFSILLYVVNILSSIIGIFGALQS